MAFSSDIPLQSNQLPISIDFAKLESEEFNNQISLTYKRIADSVNKKEGSLYLTQEIANFKQYFTANDPQTTRNAYRKTFDIVALNGGVVAPAATVTFPHGITGLLYTALIYAGCANSGGEFFTVVYPQAYLTTTDVVFTNSSASDVTQCYVVAEYLKN